MEGVGEHGQGQPGQRGAYSDEPTTVQTCQGQTDPKEGGIEGVLPADQEDPDNGQAQQTAPAALLKAVGVNVVGILGGGKTQRGNPGVNDAIENGIEFIPKDQEDPQHGQPLQALFDQRGNHGTGGQIGGKIPSR